MQERKVALVTGGSRGIGKAIAKKLACEGMDVAILATKASEQVVETVQELEAFGGKVCYYPCDVSKEEEVNQTITQIVKEFGTIHILVNNAGITKDKLLLQLTLQDMMQVLQVNLLGSMLVTKACLRTMMKQKYGRIVNVSSVVGIMGNTGQANYAASKAGIIGFTKTIAKEYGKKGITCNAVAPGFISTEMTEQLSDEVKEQMIRQIALGRYGTTEEVANLVNFLASDQATYITGEVIKIDGGLS